MSAKKIEQWEVERYWEIFASLANGGTHLSGAQAASVLKNSQLRDDQLERVWDLADVDNDGNLDFEEFCVAMRIIFDLVNGEYTDVPRTLPDWLIPSSKSHLVAAHSALAGTAPPLPSPPASPPSSSSSPSGLRDDFSWYIPPAARSSYEAIYTAHASPHNTISFPALSPLYDSLDAVPDTDIRSAWNLINPSQEAEIGKDASLAFLHVLSQRQEGYRVPRTVPKSLRATFGGSKRVEWDVEGVGRRQREEGERGGGKARFGEAYLTRIGGKGSFVPKGTDFSKENLTSDWEEVRLKRQLRDLEAKIGGIEKGGGRRREESRPALVKRELEMLMEWKRRELRELEGGEGRAKVGEGLRGVEGEIGSVGELVEGLEQHWKRREGVLEGLRREVEEEKRGR